MRGNPALRLLALARQYKLTLIFSALIGMIASIVAGLMTPHLFESEATIKIEPPKRGVLSAASAFGDNAAESSAALKNSAILLTSKEVLERAAVSLFNDGLSFDQAFPSRIRAIDLSYRFHLLKDRLKGKDVATEQEAPATTIDIERVVSLLRNQMRIAIDPETETVSIHVQAANGKAAQMMCAAVAKEFIAVSQINDRAALSKEETYLLDTLTAQKNNIDEVDRKLGEIRSAHPDVVQNASDVPSLRSVYALKFIDQRDELAKVDDELELSAGLMSTYQQALKAFAGGTSSGVFELKKRIQSELAELDFKHLEYTRVSGYPESHPSIKAIIERAKILKTILTAATSEVDSKNSRGPDEIRQQISILADKIETLNAKRAQVRKVLTSREKDMQKGLVIEAQASSLIRDLGAHLDVYKDLRRRLEETRIQIVGFSHTASLLVSPMLPTIPTTLSLTERGIFGLVVGAAAFLSLLLVMDLVSPRLLLLNDLAELNVKHFGRLKFHRDAMLEFTSCLLTMSLSDAVERRGRVVLFTRVSVSMSLEAWISEVAQNLHFAGGGAGIVIVERNSDRSIRRQSMRVDGVETCWLHADEIPFIYNQVIDQMRKTYAWVLVLSRDLDSGPATVFMMRSADHLFYLTKLGYSYLHDIESIQTSIPGDFALDQYALVV